MKDNSPECSARNIIRALSHPNLDKVAARAESLVKENYSYEAAVERYRELIPKGE